MVSQLLPVLNYDSFPESDRKIWSIKYKNTTYVSASKALRLERATFINLDTQLTICPICGCVMNNKYLVCMMYFIWKEDFTPSDLLNWQTEFLTACYIHWRVSRSKSTPARNPWTLSKIRPQASNQLIFRRSSSPPSLGPSVLPSNLL